MKNLLANQISQMEKDEVSFDEQPIRCFREVEDYEESVKNGDFKILRIYSQSENPKQPFNGPAGYISIDDIYENNWIDENIGICPVRENKDIFLCIIDIDGENTYANNDSDKAELKLGTRLLLFETINNGLIDRGLNAMCVSTANNGFHIYLYITEAGKQKHPFKNFIYPPQERKAVSQSNAIRQYPIIKNVASQKMASSALEMFNMEGKYVVGPGSIINGKKYNLLPNGVQRFQDISIYKDGSIEALIKDILEEAGFKKEDIDVHQELEVRKDNIDNPTHDLTNKNIKAIGDFIISSWPLIDGEKQMATVALGGWLSSMGVSYNSLIDIGNYVIDNKNSDTFFKGSDDHERTHGFIPSLLHDANENTNRQRQGLTSLKERFKGKIDTFKMSRLLWINSAPKTHKFYPNQDYAMNYQEVVLDFYQKKIRLNNIRQTKEGPITQSNENVDHIVNDFSYIDDISTPQLLDDSEKPLQFELQQDNGFSKKYIFPNRQHWFDKYNTTPGAYALKNSRIPAFILTEYENIGLVDTVESSSRPGIYLSKDKSQFRKFIETERGVIEQECIKPSVADLSMALKLLKQIRDEFPWQGDKFAAVIKLSLILPYGFVYKRFRRWVPGIILIGESGTLKSTMGELVCNLHTSTDINRNHYIMNGSELNSEFRMGRDISRHSYPILVNECINVFKQPGNLEFIKDAIIEEFGRNPGQGPNGEEGLVYYNRSVPIFTLNDSVEGMGEREFARRFLTINLTKKDLYSRQEIEEHLAFLNLHGIVNERFKELKIIGDFVYWFINQNMDLFSQSIFSMTDSLIKGISDYIGDPLQWLNVDIEQYIDIDITESAQGDLEYAISVLQKPFLEKKTRTYKGSTDEALLKEMLGKEYSYILQGSNGVIITKGFEKQFVQDKFGINKIITLEEFRELICDSYKMDSSIKDEVKISQRRIKNEDRRMRGLYIPWDLFLDIMRIDKNQEDDDVFIVDALND